VRRIFFQLATFANLYRNRFPNLNDGEKCLAIDLLGHVCCAADNTLIIRDKRAKLPTLICPHCEARLNPCVAPLCLEPTAKHKILELFSSLIQLPSLIQSRRPRISAMVALRRIAKHCRTAEFLDIEVSPAAQWCLKSLQSSMRELRIAAA
jgi:serine/threonine-protein kinase ATR